MASGHEVAHWSVSEWQSLAHLTVIAGIVYYFGRDAIKSALENRRSSIKKKLIETKEELDKLQIQIKEARSKIENIDQEKAALISKVELEGKKLSEALISEAKQTADRILQDAKLAAESEVEFFKKQLRQDVVDSALEKTFESLKADRNNHGALSKKIHSQLLEKVVRDTSRSFHV